MRDMAVNRVCANPLYGSACGSPCGQFPNGWSRLILSITSIFRNLLVHPVVSFTRSVPGADLDNGAVLRTAIPGRDSQPGGDSSRNIVLKDQRGRRNVGND
jgi:hypothetical protein